MYVYVCVCMHSPSCTCISQDVYQYTFTSLPLQRTPKVSLSHNKDSDPKFTWYDRRLIEMIDAHDKDVEEFFKLLALCHTVMAEEKDGT